MPWIKECQVDRQHHLLFQVAVDVDGNEYINAWFHHKALGQKPIRNIAIIRDVLEGNTLRATAQKYGLAGPERVREIVRKFLWRTFPSTYEWCRNNQMPDVLRMHKGWVLRALKEYEVWYALD